jgi:hypothetical protein
MIARIWSARAEIHANYQSIIVNHNVIIIHYFGWQARSRFGGIVRDGDDLLKRIADMKCAQ